MCAFENIKKTWFRFCDYLGYNIVHFSENQAKKREQQLDNLKKQVEIEKYKTEIAKLRKERQGNTPQNPFG
jgi:hypothetical protein